MKSQVYKKTVNLTFFVSKQGIQLSNIAENKLKTRWENGFFMGGYKS